MRDRSDSQPSEPQDAEARPAEARPAEARPGEPRPTEALAAGAHAAAGHAASGQDAHGGIDASVLHAGPTLMRSIVARRSLRAFDPQPPSDAALQRVFEAARWAPSGGNGQPWRFVVARAGSEPFERLVGTLRRGNAWARSAPVLILATVKTVHDRPDKPVRANRRALLDLGLAVQNLLLQAAEEGLGTHPMAGFEADEAARIVGMPEENHQAVLMIALGRWGDASLLEADVRAKDERPRVRQPLSEMVFEGDFGRAAGFAVEDEA